MKNAFSILAALAMLGSILGCSVLRHAQNTVSTQPSNSNATDNRTITEKAIDTAVGDEKVGIPECDEVIDMLVAQTNDPEDNFVTKAIKATALKKFREQVKKGLESSNTNRKDTVQFCSEFKTELQKASKQPANANAK